MSRVSTGSAQIDEILGGGFLRHSINIVMGDPGSGKTVLLERLVFHNAGPERPILYLTTLAEPLSKMVTYLQRFRFFDAQKLGSQIVYEDIGAAIAKDGVSELVRRIEQAIKSESPQIIVIDSFKAVVDLAADLREARRMLFDLAGLLSAYDTTVFLVGEYSDPDAMRAPEFAVADGILQLTRRGSGARDERSLRVLKLRGSSYREGHHAFRITDAGLDVFPRLVTPAAPERYRPAEERLSTGVPGMDEMLGGGLWRGSAALIIGPTGSGKTTLALQFALEGVKRGEPVLFLNLQENPSQLRRLLASYGVDFEKMAQRGLHLLYYSPVELLIDSIVVELARLIDERSIRRVVIDTLGDLAVAADDPRRLHDYIYTLVQIFAVKGVTSILTLETASEGILQTQGVSEMGRFSYMTDAIIQLRVREQDERLIRTVRVAKHRASRPDPRVRTIELGPAGARVC